MFIISNAITLLLVMDPFGNIPAFLALLSNMDPGRRRRVILRELIIALAILIIFLLFGGYILKGMHISEPALSIAGGLILFLIALKMIFPETVRGQGISGDEEPLIVPLAVPLIAGPSTIVMLTLLATRHPDRITETFLALLIAWLSTVLILLLSDLLRTLMGTRILKAIERLMGMILTTVAVQMLLSGIAEYLSSLGMI
ncbi:MarC family protein [Marispirochaeta aestuarii]|uniref:MarC family protein n=1 Tax=Marispirochaeta aestuarii TaxID=1963862 RepID=UPI0029C959EA|nr:MarC family protein [Marispirochaeta aestuarii]